jgi:hypothetical protein
MSWLRTLDNTDWKQKAYELGAVSGLGYFANLTLSDWASFIEKLITFAVSITLALLAFRRHRKKMKLLELEEQERLQRLYDMGEKRKRNETD